MVVVKDKIKIEKYPAYKDSGAKWLGDIPIHWETLIGNYIFKVINERSYKGDEELLSVSEHHGVRPRSLMKVNTFMAESYEGYKLCSPGDLVINSLWAWSKGLGISDYKGIISTAYSVYRPDQNRYSKSYLHYLLRIENYVAQYLIASRGIWISRLLLSDWSFMRIPILTPPLDEQTAIAQFLDRKTVLIDQALSIKEKQIELLKERRHILIHKAVTRGLNPDVKMKESGVEWIGQIPEHWVMVPIRRVMDIRDGTHDTPLYIEDGVDSFPLVTSKDFDGDVINFENIKKISQRDHINISKRSGVKKGDVLMSMIGGNIGKSVIIGDNDDFSIKNVALFRTNGDIVFAKFLSYYFESGLLQNQIDLKSRGGAQGFLSLGDIRNLVFFKTPIDERNQIVEFLEKHVSMKFKAAISLKEQEIEKLKEYKATLINSAVTGKIKIC